jgi:hypothetical protein
VPVGKTVKLTLVFEVPECLEIGATQLNALAIRTEELG